MQSLWPKILAPYLPGFVNASPAPVCSACESYGLSATQRIGFCPPKTGIQTPPLCRRPTIFLPWRDGGPDMTWFGLSAWERHRPPRRKRAPHGQRIAASFGRPLRRPAARKAASRPLVPRRNLRTPRSPPLLERLALLSLSRWRIFWTRSSNPIYRARQTSILIGAAASSVRDRSPVRARRAALLF